MRARDELLAAIDREQALIGRLGREREEALARVRSLQAQLGTPGEDVDCSVSPSPPSTAGEKVALFRGVFRGRDDVFPKLWVNPRTDRKGYAPACSNEAAIRGDEERLMLATGRYIGEGFDDARLDTLFLAMPVSWKGTLVQYTGRLHRLSPGKTEVRIYDYVDPAVPMLARMFEKRLRGYRAIGYASDERPLESTQPQEESTVEYDEDVFPDFDTAP